MLHMMKRSLHSLDAIVFPEVKTKQSVVENIYALTFTKTCVGCNVTSVLKLF